MTANEGDPREVWGTDGVTKFEGVEVARSSIADGSHPVRFGSRSITVYDHKCLALWDSGSQLGDAVKGMCETGELSPSAAKAISKRDDKRGIEPEGLAVYTQGDSTHLYVGLERTGMVAHYLSNSSGNAFELLEMLVIPQSEPDDRLPAPEGLVIIPRLPQSKRPPMLLVTDEVFGKFTRFPSKAHAQRIIPAADRSPAHRVIRSSPQDDATRLLCSTIRNPRCGSLRLTSNATFGSIVGPSSMSDPKCRSTRRESNSVVPQIAPAMTSEAQLNHTRYRLGRFPYLMLLNASIARSRVRA